MKLHKLKDSSSNIIEKIVQIPKENSLGFTGKPEQNKPRHNITEEKTPQI